MKDNKACRILPFMYVPMCISLYKHDLTWHITQRPEKETAEHKTEKSNLSSEKTVRISAEPTPTVSSDKRSNTDEIGEGRSLMAEPITEKTITNPQMFTAELQPEVTEVTKAVARLVFSFACGVII